MSRLVSTLDAAVAVGRPPATIRDWARKGLIRTYGTGRRRAYDLREVQAVHDRLRSAKVAGHHRRLRAVLRDTRPADLDLALDMGHAETLSVVPRVPDDLEERAGDYGTFGPAINSADRPGLAAE